MTETSERVTQALASLSDLALSLLIQGLPIPKFVYASLFTAEASRRTAYLEDAQARTIIHLQLEVTTPEILKLNLALIDYAIKLWESKATKDMPDSLPTLTEAHREARNVLALIRDDLENVLDRVKKLKEENGDDAGTQQTQKE